MKTYRIPMQDAMSLRNAMNRLFEDSFVWPVRGVPSDSIPQLLVDVYETSEAVIIEARVPGLKPDEIQIQVLGDTVTISGELKSNEDRGTPIIQEYHFGPFTRTIQLSVPVNPEHAEADFENGILTLTLPKVEEVKPKTIPVKVK